MLSIEYIAGFIDGEGSFGIYPHQTRMTVSNLNVGVLYMIRESLGAGGRIVSKSQGRDCYELTMGATGLRVALPQLIPHLHVKRLLAELILEYLGPIPIRNRIGYVVPPGELERRERLRKRVCEINRSRGRLAWGTRRGV